LRSRQTKETSTIHYRRDDAFREGRLAAEAGDTAQAAREMEAFAIAFANPDVRVTFRVTSAGSRPPRAAGHPEKADAVLKAAGTYVDCYRSAPT